MKSLHEKIMISLFVISVIGFLIAPCCWITTPKTITKGVISCPKNKVIFRDSLQQKNNVAANNIKNYKH